MVYNIRRQQKVLEIFLILLEIILGFWTIYFGRNPYFYNEKSYNIKKYK